MNILKKISALAIVLIGSTAFSQNVSNIEHDKMTATKKVTFETTDGAETPYRMKVVERRSYKFAFEEEDKGKLNQDRVIMPAFVEKEIYIDNDKDSYYDKMMVIRYMKNYEDKIQVRPMGNDVVVKFNGDTSSPITKAGFYMTDASDNDFFYVEEFKTY